MVRKPLDITVDGRRWALARERVGQRYNIEPRALELRMGEERALDLIMTEYRSTAWEVIGQPKLSPELKLVDVAQIQRLEAAVDALPGKFLRARLAAFALGWLLGGACVALVAAFWR